MGRATDISMRYRELNELLNNHIGPERAVKLETVAKKLGISDRQAGTYLRYFRDEIGAPLHFDNSKNGWFYSASFAFIERLSMTHEELQQLRIALEMLTEQKGLAARFGLLADTLAKIERGTKTVATHRKRGKAIFFDPLSKNTGAKLLPFFLDAIEQDWRTTFDYKPIGMASRAVIFDPYFLRQWEGRWYVGGQSHDPTELTFVRTYPLDRIIGQPVRDGYFHKKPAGFSAENYWANIYGITDPRGDKTVEDVVLRFEGVQKNFFLEAPFFPNFKIMEETDQAVTVLLRLKINIELMRKIASYGHELTVLGPPRLVGDMRGFFKKAVGKYG